MEKNSVDIEAIERIKTYLRLGDLDLTGLDALEAIKAMCVARICKSVGIKCKCNSQNKYFNFFAMITGQAVADKFGLRIEIAPASLRLVKYDHKNLVTEVTRFLESEDVDEAFVDSFNMIDNYTYLIDKI